MTIETIDLENLPAYFLDETWKDTFKLSPPRKRSFDLEWESDSRIKRSKSLADMAGTRTKNKEVFRYSDMMWDEEMANVGSVSYEETEQAATHESRFTIDLTKDDVLEYLDHLEQAPVPGTTDQASTSASRGVQTEIPDTPVVSQDILSANSNLVATGESRGTQTENPNNPTFESHGIQTEIPLPAVVSQTTFPEESNLIATSESCGTQTENLNSFESHGVQTENSHPATFESRHVQTDAAIAHAVVDPQELSENSTSQSSIPRTSNPPSTDTSEASQSPVFGFSTITYVDPSERFVKPKQERTILWDTTERSVKPYVTWDESVTTRYALFCGNGNRKFEKPQKDNLVKAAKVLELFRLKYVFPPEILQRNRRERIMRIFVNTFGSELQLKLSEYFKDQSIYSWRGRHLVATVAQRMLSAGEKVALATHLLWTYETMYAQLAQTWPEIYAPKVDNLNQRTTDALDELVLATTDAPADEQFTASGRRYNSQKSLLNNRRTYQKGEAILFSNFLIEVAAFVRIQVKASRGSYRKELVDIAEASIIQEYVAKHRGAATTVVAVIAQSMLPDWRGFFLQEIKKSIGDNFETWAKTISEPYSDIPDGQIKTKFIVSQNSETPDQFPDIYSPFHLCWQSIKQGVRGACVKHLEVVKWERVTQGLRSERRTSSSTTPFGKITGQSS